MFRESPEGIDFVRKHARRMRQNQKAPGPTAKGHLNEPLVLRVKVFECMGATETFVPLSSQAGRTTIDLTTGSSTEVFGSIIVKLSTPVLSRSPSL